MIGQNDLEYFSRSARAGCLNRSEQTALIEELITQQREREELLGLMREMCAYLRSGSFRSIDEFRNWLADRIPGNLK